MRERESRRIRVLRTAVDHAKLGQSDKLAAIQRLDQQARELEGTLDGESFDEIVQQERAASAFHGGMSVHGPERPE
jgi:uncharacterized protein